MDRQDLSVAADGTRHGHPTPISRQRLVQIRRASLHECGAVGGRNHEAERNRVTPQPGSRKEHLWGRGRSETAGAVKRDWRGGLHQSM